LSDKFVDVSLPITKVTALNVVLELARPPASSGVRELEGPQEIGCLDKYQLTFLPPPFFAYLLEVGAGSGDFVHQVLYTKDVKLAKRLLNDSVVSEGDALFVDLAVSTLVNQLADRLEIGFTLQHSFNGRVGACKTSDLPVRHIGLNQAEHLLCCAGGLHKDTIVDLQKSEELQNFARFRGDLIDTEEKHWSRHHLSSIRCTHPRIRMTK
jgi:hypothetical protein